MHANSRATSPSLDPANPYLTGVHTPMREELTIEDLPVTGTIPPAFDGRYLRMGPNPMTPIRPSITGSPATA